MWPKVFNWMRPMKWGFNMAKHASKHRIDPNVPVATILSN